MKKNSLSQITLLYIEDEIDIREELYELLEYDCLKLIAACDGKDGLEKYKKFQPDMILTDIRMPIMSGLEMAKEIRKTDSDIPIIVSSAFNDSKYLLDAINMGISDYLLKPINLKKLYEVLEKVATNIIIKKDFLENEKLLSQYKDVVDSASIVSKTDTKGNITYMNDAFIFISGYKREELMGNNHNMLRHPDMSKEIFKDMWKTISARKHWHGVIKNRAKDGSTYIVDSTIIPILNSENEIVEFISTRTDITQLELQKENLKLDLDSSSKFIEEFETAIKQNTLFCRTDINGVINMTSEEFDRLFGYEDGLLEGTMYHNLIAQKNQKKITSKIASNINQAKVYKGRITHINSAAKELFLESSFMPIVGIDGQVLEVFCFFTNVSEVIELNSEIIATQREVISTMGAIGETRSQETGAHVKRVAEYSKHLALKAGLSLEVAEELKMASPMHDIGKVAIPDSILNKPGKLTEDEFEIMKTHAELGYEMLRHSNQKLLQSAAIVAEQHHEKWDGTGYPKKLSGENIHIYGRITAIADVFDALGHDRVYKKAWPMENIFNLFREERGKHFDPTLIDLFMDNLDEFLIIKGNFDGK